MSEKTTAEEELSNNEVADRLRDLADALDEPGTGSIQVGNKTVTLDPASTVSYEIDVRERSTLLGGDRESISLEIDWKPE